MRHKDIHSYNTRHNAALLPNFVRLKRNQSFNYYSVKFYNKLSESTQNLGIKQFKRQISDYLIKNAFYNYYEFLSVTSVIVPPSNVLT